MTKTTSVKITHGETVVDCAAGETVLQALLRAGIDASYSCGNGMCLTCISKLVNGAIPPDSQIGIKDTLQAQGYFLPCVCEPSEDIEVAAPDDAALFGRAIVTEVAHPSANVCRVRMMPATPLYYRAGQFINVRRSDGLMRAYSLASVPSLDRYLELHVKRLPRGQMSNWFYEELQPGEAVDIQGPSGSCFYVPDDRTSPLLLIGNGSGLSPLVGIARDALNDGHTGPIHLYHGTRSEKGLYLDNMLRKLAAAHTNLTYQSCLSREERAESRHGRAEDVALEDYPDLTGWRVYLCGYPPMVRDTQRRAFMAGAALPDIYIDPFELRDLRKKPRD